MFSKGTTDASSMGLGSGAIDKTFLWKRVKKATTSVAYTSVPPCPEIHVKDQHHDAGVVVVLVPAAGDDHLPAGPRRGGLHRVTGMVTQTRSHGWIAG